MKKTIDKSTLQYRVLYFYPPKEDSELKFPRGEDFEIDIQNFSPTVPSGSYGYLLFYGTTTQGYHGYSVYKGNLFSFKDAVEKFPEETKSLFPKITKEMIENGKSTEELREYFSQGIDLQEKFNQFVAECEAMTISEDNTDTNSSSNDMIGVLISDKYFINYVYSQSIVIL